MSFGLSLRGGFEDLTCWYKPYCTLFLSTAVDSSEMAAVAGLAPLAWLCWERPWWLSWQLRGCLARQQPLGATDGSTRQATNDLLMHHLGPTCGTQTLSLARLAALPHTLVGFFVFFFCNLFYFFLSFRVLADVINENHMQPIAIKRQRGRLIRALGFVFFFFFLFFLWRRIVEQRPAGVWHVTPFFFLLLIFFDT